MFWHLIDRSKIPIVNCTLLLFMLFVFYRFIPIYFCRNSVVFLCHDFLISPATAAIISPGA